MERHRLDAEHLAQFAHRDRLEADIVGEAVMALATGCSGEWKASNPGPTLPPATARLPSGGTRASPSSASPTPSPAAAPPAPAGADVVLDAYLRALVAGDCEAGRRLATSSFVDGNGELCAATRVSAHEINPVPAGGANEQVLSTKITTSGTSDGSIYPGAVTWFYDLVEQAGRDRAARRRVGPAEQPAASSPVGDPQMPTLSIQ